MRTSFSLKSFVEKLGGVTSGNPNVEITKVGSLALADSNAISFFIDTKYTAQLDKTEACAVILKPEHANLTAIPKIITDNPYAYFAKVSSLLNPVDIRLSGCHHSSVVDASCKIPVSCSIGPNVVIEAGATLGEYVVIGSGTVVEKNVEIGDHTVLESNVTIKHGITIGKHCHLFSGCVIGSDGFGYAEKTNADNSKHWVKIPQVIHGLVVDNTYLYAGDRRTGVWRRPLDELDKSVRPLDRNPDDDSQTAPR